MEKKWSPQYVIALILLLIIPYLLTLLFVQKLFGIEPIEGAVAAIGDIFKIIVGAIIGIIIGTEKNGKR